MPLRRAEVEHRLRAPSTSAWVSLRERAAAARDVEHVLHGDDGRARERLLDLLRVHVAERDVADLALGLHRDQRVERLHEGHAGGRA